MVTLRTQHAGKRTTREGTWMNGTEIYSHFSSSRLPRTVVCVVYPAGWRRLALSADFDSAVGRSITRAGSSKCRRNGKVLTTRTSRNPHVQDAATKVGVTLRNDGVRVEPKLGVMPSGCTVYTTFTVTCDWQAINSPLLYISIFDPWKTILLVGCGLLFIISLQFPAESHLCDSSCRADNKSRTMPFATVIYAVHVCQHGKKASINCITPVRCGHRKKEDARRVLPSQTWLGSERKMWPRVSPIH